jgi:hypothetical protein
MRPETWIQLAAPPQLDEIEKLVRVRTSSRRDWIELHLRSAVDLERLRELLAVALAANA